MDAEIVEADVIPHLPPEDPLAGKHTSVVIQWAGNPPQYVLHVNSALDAEGLTEFLIHELKRISKALRAEPITTADVSEIPVEDLAEFVLADITGQVSSPVASLLSPEVV